MIRKQTATKAAPNPSTPHGRVDYKWIALGVTPGSGVMRNFILGIRNAFRFSILLYPGGSLLAGARQGKPEGGLRAGTDCTLMEAFP
jgi:hypothetical protein